MYDSAQFFTITPKKLDAFKGVQQICRSLALNGTCHRFFTGATTSELAELAISALAYDPG